MLELELIHGSKRGPWELSLCITSAHLYKDQYRKRSYTHKLAYQAKKSF